MNIRLPRHTETLDYAAEELSRYLGRMCDTDGFEISLGLLSDFSLSEEGVGDPMIDDVIDVDIRDGKGYIAGSNERSVLQGVYLYLKSGGCMWVRPGADGEYIPQKEMSDHRFKYRKKADFPFRGECIEGAVSFEHVRDTVLWLPKVGMNLFMMEQIVPYNYMSRWYEHEASTTKQDEGVSFEKIGEYVAQLEKTIKKCGLQLHALGHGYLLEPYGVHYKKYGLHYDLPDAAREDVALVGGKRELFHGSPNFTQLCMSKDSARLGLVNFLVSYLERKPYIDFLHVWMSDAANNHCECENCRKMTPTDFYVRMLNELDAELTARGIPTKIVFIMYVDTLWAPEKERFHNPSRFIMTTAANRSRSVPLDPERSENPLPPYRRNDYRVDNTFAQTLSFMDAWKPTFDGRKFLFEYYFYTDHYYDPGQFQIAKLISEDVAKLPAVGFDGIMSDQTQRSFFPTGLPLSVLGEELFDKGLDFDRFRERYFKAAFGRGWEIAEQYLREITRLFDPCSLRDNVGIVVEDTGTGEATVVPRAWKGNPEAEERFRKIAPLADTIRPLCKSRRSAKDPCHAKSWALLDVHTEYVTRLSEILLAASRGDRDKAERLFAEMLDWLSQIEDEIAPQFDLVLFKQKIGDLIRK